MKLQGKTALVTGGSRGIGRAIAARLAADGAIVAVHYGRSAADALLAVNQIEEAGGKAFAVSADLISISAISAMFEKIDGELAARTGASTLDILVNNAGVAIPDDNLTERDFDRMFDTNVKAMFFMTEAAIPRLPNGGRIVNISSLAAIRGEPAYGAYAATKGAIRSLSLSLALRLGSRGITVNVVAPGATETALIARELANPDMVQLILQMTALGRVGQPADIADVVAFLASSEARWITGQAIGVDGGLRL